MSDEIIKVLDDLSQRFGIAVDWTSSNALPYLQELAKKYVNYRLAMSAMELALGILFFVAAMKLVKEAKRQHYKAKEERRDYFDDNFHDGIAMACLAGAASAIVIDIFLIPSALGDIVTCMTFPEKLMLDELLQVLKNH